MAYKCVNCSEVYADSSNEALTNCSKCGGKFFFYIKDDKLREIQKEIPQEEKLTAKDKEQMEQDVRELVGIENEEEAVFLDFESVKIMKPGKYLIDVSKLFANDKPRVYKLEDGKYIIDLASKIKTRVK